jgi:hypothetical protein
MRPAAVNLALTAAPDDPVSAALLSEARAAPRGASSLLREGRWPAAQRGVHLVGVHRRARHHALQPRHADHARARALGQRGHAGGERARRGPAHQQGAGGHPVWLPAAHRSAHHRGAARRAAGALPARPAPRAGLRERLHAERARVVRAPRRPGGRPRLRALRALGHAAHHWLPASQLLRLRGRHPACASACLRGAEPRERAAVRAHAADGGHPPRLPRRAALRDADPRRPRRHAQPLAQRGAAPGPLHG